MTSNYTIILGNRKFYQYKLFQELMSLFCRRSGAWSERRRGRSASSYRPAIHFWHCWPLWKAVDRNNPISTGLVPRIQARFGSMPNELVGRECGRD